MDQQTSVCVCLCVAELDGYSSAVEEIVVPDMHTRKQMFFERVGTHKHTHTHTHTHSLSLSPQANMFIALPGGIGTMEELTEMLTWQALKLHSKPIGLLNTDNYYDPFLQWVYMAPHTIYVHTTYSTCCTV